MYRQVFAEERRDPCAGLDGGAPAQKRRRLDDGHHLESQTTSYSYTFTTCNNYEHEYPPLNHAGNAPEDCQWTYGEAEQEAVCDAHESSLICCYGMLPRIPVCMKLLKHDVIPQTKNLSVTFEYPNILRQTTNGEDIYFEIQCSKSAQILFELESAEEVNTQLYCQIQPDFSPVSNIKSNNRRKARKVQSWSLNIIIYGPVSLEEPIGEFLSQRQMYLQDPSACDRVVPYRNPHIIPSESGEVVMTNALELSADRLEIERLNIAPDLLTQLMQDEKPLPETDAPPEIVTPLFSHQRQALTFLLGREQGWAMRDGSGDIWTRQCSRFGTYIFVNSVTGASQEHPPPDFRGGLLADDMGLGKTLSMICLIVANRGETVFPSPSTTSELNPKKGPSINTTLLIVPPPLIQAWEKQFSLHVRSNTLKLHVFHGQNRKGIDFLGQYDVVITTFQTVSAIWRKHNDTQGDPESIFSVIWHRIVLDEAHIIQNAQSYLARSCCALQSVSRWAITGTPIQNKLSDFASIVRFLRVNPYSEQVVFDGDISRPWHRGDEQGFLRLKTLVRAITISRTKAVVQLPPRVDEIHHLDFSSFEKVAYDDAKQFTVRMLDHAISSGDRGRTTFNALQRLNVLRLICSHGLLASQHQIMEQAPTTFTQYCGQEDVIDSLATHGTCLNCGMDFLEDLVDELPLSYLEPPIRNEVGVRTLCRNCNSQSSCKTFLQAPLGSRQVFESYGTTSGSMSLSPSPTRMGCDGNQSRIDSMSTKIKALTEDISKHSSREKNVVFSYWTYTLDLIQLMLNDRRIPYTRIDGKTSLPKRADALKCFHRDATLRVILVSITCGGAGLDLTAASRVYLMEPHWNPMIEEQALCRVHRVGQKRSVTTIRYLMRDSFEEQVVEIQKRKKLLAQVAFGHDPLPESEISLGTLQYLKSVLE